jgi:KDO2-lipid IV(A) lauroyltransferase
MGKRIYFWVVGRFFRAVFFAASILPMWLLVAWARGLGTFFYIASKRYRTVAFKNLDLAYGDTMSRSEKRHIVHEVFRNFAKAAVAEFPYVASLPPDSIKQLVELDKESYEKVVKLHGDGRGTIIVSAHMGNFEFGARRLAAEGYKFAVVIRMDENPVMSELFVSVRNKGGYEVIERGIAPRHILRRLRDGGAVVMLADQKSDDVWTPFFGHLAGTVAGPAVMALRTGARIIPTFCIRLSDKSHKLFFFDPIDTTSTGDQQADVQRIMNDVTAVIERVVRQYPEQWLWLHNRWVAQPPAELVEKWEAHKQAAMAGF